MVLPLSPRCSTTVYLHSRHCGEHLASIDLRFLKVISYPYTLYHLGVIGQSTPVRMRMFIVGGAIMLKGQGHISANSQGRYLVVKNLDPDRSYIHSVYVSDPLPHVPGVPGLRAITLGFA